MRVVLDAGGEVGESVGQGGVAGVFVVEGLCPVLEHLGFPECPATLVRVSATVKQLSEMLGAGQSRLD